MRNFGIFNILKYLKFELKKKNKRLQLLSTYTLDLSSQKISLKEPFQIIEKSILTLVQFLKKKLNFNLFFLFNFFNFDILLKKMFCIYVQWNMHIS